jgi:hypothetical protein
MRCDRTQFEDERSSWWDFKGQVMDIPFRPSEKLWSQQSLPSSICTAPDCAQCRSPMMVILCEPDLHNCMVATYRCRKCGLLDRAQVQ